jgi:tetratricopeptide (TPR) repeat protein
LYLRNNNVNTLYKIAAIQIDLKRYNEAKTNLDILLSNKGIEEIKYYFPVNENEEQEIPMRAALHNLKGIIAREQGNNPEANKQFSIALEISPDFAMAKANLQDLAK